MATLVERSTGQLAAGNSFQAVWENNNDPEWDGESRTPIKQHIQL